MLIQFPGHPFNLEGTGLMTRHTGSPTPRLPHSLTSHDWASGLAGLGSPTSSAGWPRDRHSWQRRWGEPSQQCLSLQL